jgi:hypothetical protein
MKWWLHVLILLVIVLFGAAPILSAVIAGSIASANGCELHEGFANPCVIAGRDYGQLLYNMGVMGWLALLTFPLAAFTVLSYLIALLVFYAVRRRKKSSGVVPPRN